MKKAIAVIVVLLAIGGGVFYLLPNWQSLTGALPTAEDPAPFDKDFDVNQETVDYFVEGDSLDTMEAAGLFYFGAYDLPGGMAAEYEQARKEKVQAIVSEAAKVGPLIEANRSKNHALLRALTTFFEATTQEDPEIGAYGDGALSQILAAESAAAATLAQAQAAASVSAEDPFAKAMVDEIGVLSSVQAGVSYAESVDLTVSHAVYAVLAAESHSSTTVQQAGITLDTALSRYDSWNSELEQILQTSLAAHNGYEQLATADYYFGCSALTYVADNATKLQEAANSLTPNAEVTAEDIEFIKAMANTLIETNNQFLAEANAVESTRLIPLQAQSIPFYGAAYANGSQSDYQAAFQSLKTGLSSYAKTVESGINRTASALKTAAQKTQRVIQFTTDASGDVVRIVSTIPNGIYYGNSWSEMKQDIRSDLQAIQDNYNGKLPPKTTLRRGKEMFDSMEAAIDEGIRQQAEGYVGEYPAWFMGKAGKLVAGAFTGFAKGTYLLADPSSTNSEYVEGIMEVAMASIGGSKVVFSTSGGLKGSAQGLKEAFRQTSGFFNRQRIRAEIAKIIERGTTTSADDALAVGLANLREMSSKLRALEKLEALKGELVDKLKNQAGTWFVSAGDEIGDTLYGTFREKFGNNLRGLAGAFGDAMGDSVVDFIDNVFAAVIDDALKAEVSSWFEERLSRDLIRGGYNATFTLREFRVNADKPAQDPNEEDDDSCMDIDIDDKEIQEAIRKNLNKPQPASIGVVPADDENGTITISFGDGDPLQIKYVYAKDGTLKAEQRQGASVVRLTGRFNQEEVPEGDPPAPVTVELKGVIEGEGFFIAFDMEGTHR